jgi:hypothetical protein
MSCTDLLAFLNVFSCVFFFRFHFTSDSSTKHVIDITIEFDTHNDGTTLAEVVSVIFGIQFSRNIV